MSVPLLICDVGDVLVHTVHGAQYRELERRTGVSGAWIAELVGSSGIAASLERGELDADEFTEALRDLLSCPGLQVEDVREAWRAVLLCTDPVVTSAVARYASVGRLVLASNTNTLHWPVVRQLLREEGIDAPAYLSYELGYQKPDPRFFHAMMTRCLDLDDEAVIYVDDRVDNVATALECGLAGVVHRIPAATASYLVSAFSTVSVPVRPPAIGAVTAL